MFESMITIYNRSLKGFLKNRFRKIREINKKYANSTIKMTPAVKISLLLLRLYLIFLVFILMYKFITLLR